VEFIFFDVAGAWWVQNWLWWWPWRIWENSAR